MGWRGLAGIGSWQTTLKQEEIGNSSLVPQEYPKHKSDFVRRGSSMPSCNCWRPLAVGISRADLPEVFAVVPNLGSQCWCLVFGVWCLVSSSISLCQSFSSSWAVSLELKSPVFYLASGPWWVLPGQQEKRKGSLPMGYAAMPVPAGVLAKGLAFSIDWS